MTVFLSKAWIAIKKAARWLYDRWYIPLFVLGVLLGFFISGKLRRRGNPLKQTSVELEAINAAADARTAIAELGAEKARARVEATYRSKLEALDDVQKKTATELRDDPEKLARFLVRAARD